MRNLKKILALVLALVMSLSLMAVASADDELNLGDVSETYAESVDVLTSLKVFMGNKGEFLPKDNITRAEVAAIIYRIVTGDVADAQKGIYADYNKFSDVTSDAWYAGYVNYCANAEYVKGVGYDANGKAMFKPQQNVTGYEALAMILRAIGYDRNNEFTGPSWQIQTAATARNRGILKNIVEGTLGGAATREAVAEILCQTILVPVADYSLAFGYRTTDANGKDNETLAYKTFKMEKIEGVVLANEYAALDADTPLPAGQTKLELRDDTTKTMDVASDLDAIGESRYVYVVPQAGTTRYDLKCSKLYGEENNNIYDNEGAEVATVNGSTGSAAGITSIEGAEHFVNFSQNDEYETKIRIKYVMKVRMSQYDAMLMYYQNGNKDNSMLKDLVNETENKAKDSTGYSYIPFPSEIDKTWTQLITSNATHTYEYTKVIPAFTKLTDTDWANLRSIFANADRLTGDSFVIGEVFVGTNSTTTFDILNITASRDVSDYITWEKFVADYLNVKENKTQVTSNGLGQHLKIVDNNQDGVAEYVLQTKYTVAVMAANGTSLDVSGVQLVDSKVRDNINSVPSATTPFFSTEGLAAGDVVVYALIDGKIHATKAEGETVKINTVNRANSTATATGEDGKTWSESDVHTHSQANGLVSGVTGMVGNTTYNIYFDLYGNLAAYTEGTNGGLVLITNGWYNNTISGPEYAIQAYVDGKLQTVTGINNGSLFIGNNASSNNTWNQLKTTFGSLVNDRGNINDQNVGRTDNRTVHTIVANLDGSILTPVDKTYRYSQNLRMLDMYEDVIPGRSTNSWAIPYETTYGVNNTAYQTPDNDDATHASAPNSTIAGTKYHEVRALSNTVYYTVYRGVGYDTTVGNDRLNNVVVRSYTGYSNVPSSSKNYIEDVYAVGAKATTATGETYYAAQVVVIELNDNYYESRRDSEQVFIPDFSEVSGNIGIENVTMIRGNGEISTVAVDMTKSSTVYNYDPANGATHGSRRAGLFYMDPSDSNPDVYVIQRMSPAQIRADNYLAGYVRESYAVLSNNYAQVELFAQPAGGPIWTMSGFGSNASLTDWTTAQKTRPIPGSTAGLKIWDEKAVTADSKTYTYGGSTATLVAADPAVVLSQGGNGNAGETVNGLNERWDGANTPADAVWPYNFANFSTINRNEVLVRYDANGNVIWAVSFNETNAAQMVWWNSLPAATETTGLSFWGNRDNNADKRIEISHNQVVAGSKFIDFGNALGTTIENYQIYPVVNGVVSTTPMTRTEELNKTAPGLGREEYQVVVTLKNGTRETYTLIKDIAAGAAELTSTNAAVATVDQAAKRIHAVDKNMSISQFKSNFASTGVGGIEAAVWKFFNASGTELTNPDGDMTLVKHFQVTIKAEDGTEITYYDDEARPYTLTVLRSDGTVAKVTDGKVANEEWSFTGNRGREENQYFTISDEEGNFYGVNGQLATKLYDEDPNVDSGSAKFTYVASGTPLITLPDTMSNITITQGYHAANVAGVTNVNGTPVNDAVGGAGPEVLFLKAGDTVTLMKDSAGRLLEGKYVLVDNNCTGTDWGAAASASTPASWLEIVDGAVTITMPNGDLHYRDNYYGVLVDGELKGHVYHNDKADVSTMVSGSYYLAAGETTPVVKTTKVACNDADIELTSCYKVTITVTGAAATDFDVVGGMDISENATIAYVVKAGENISITPKSGKTLYINGVAYNKDGTAGAETSFAINGINADVAAAISDTAPTP